MSKFYDVKLRCETPEIKDVVTQILLASKSNMQQHITSLLGRKGVASDTKIKFQNDEIIITQKTGDRGMVIVSQGVGMEAVGYDTVPDNSKYIIVEEGMVKIMLKRPDNIDILISGYEDLETAISSINSNDVVTAVDNIVNPKTENLLEQNEGAEDTIENGNTEATV